MKLQRDIIHVSFSNLYLGDFRAYGSIGHNYYGLAVNHGVNMVHEWALSVNNAAKKVNLGSGESIYMINL